MYKAEDDHQPMQYTAAQLGEPVYYSVSNKSKDPYDLFVLDENYQIQLLEGCPWDVCSQRVKAMVRAGVDPTDIRGMRYRREANGPGWREAGLENVNVFLWWTTEDQRRFEKDQAA